MMNIHDELRTELGRLNHSDALATGPHSIAIDCEGGRLTCDLLALDSLGVSFRELKLSTAKLAEATFDELKVISDRLAARLTYLLEPIAPVEFDSEGCVVQLRSNPPYRDDDGRHYYELVVRRGGEIRLCRYLKTTGDPREIVPAQVTREVLGRLVEDVSSARVQ